MPTPTGNIPSIPIRGVSKSKFQREDDDPTMEDRGVNPNILRFMSLVQWTLNTSKIIKNKFKINLDQEWWIKIY